MHFLWALVIGLCVGAVAKFIMPGKDPGGILITSFLGIVGSMLAGFLGRSLGLFHANDPAPGFIASVIGAMLVLGLYRVVRRRSRP